jgi:hypothetical protein
VFDQEKALMRILVEAMKKVLRVRQATFAHLLCGIRQFRILFSPYTYQIFDVEQMAYSLSLRVFD